MARPSTNPRAVDMVEHMKGTDVASWKVRRIAISIKHDPSIGSGKPLLN